MPTKRILLACTASACLACALLPAQEKSPRERLAAAHAQYYTPTTAGLKSFHCDATVDWKGMLSRFSGKDIADDNPMLVYLNSARLTISDDLHGKGEMQWTEGGAPPAGKEAAAKQISEGFRQVVEGFFQSWNPFMNGGMVPYPDHTVEITPSGDGLHLSGKTGDVQVDEDFDKNMLLTQALVIGPQMHVLATPVYARTADGLVVSSVASQVHQPPDAPETDITFQIEYAKVDSFQIPSHVVFDIKNVGIMEFRTSNCEVALADWAKKNLK